MSEWMSQFKSRPVTTHSLDVAVDDVSWSGEAIGDDSVLATDITLHLLADAVVKP